MATEMYNRGFDDGVDDAVNCCFGGCKRSAPYFETREEEADYYEGRDDGYASVDD